MSASTNVIERGCERVDPAQRLALVVAQIVDDNQLVAGGQQLDASVGTDIAGAPPVTRMVDMEVRSRNQT